MSWFRKLIYYEEKTVRDQDKLIGEKQEVVAGADELRKMDAASLIALLAPDDEMARTVFLKVLAIPIDLWREAPDSGNTSTHAIFEAPSSGGKPVLFEVHLNPSTWQGHNSSRYEVRIGERCFGMSEGLDTSTDNATYRIGCRTISCSSSCPFGPPIHPIAVLGYKLFAGLTSPRLETERALRAKEERQADLDFLDGL